MGHVNLRTELGFGAMGLANPRTELGFCASRLQILTFLRSFGAKGPFFVKQAYENRGKWTEIQGQS